MHYEKLMKKPSLFILIFIFIIPSFIFARKINRLRFISLLNRYSYNKNYPKESYFSISFKNIIPCGIGDKAVTSMHQELGRLVAFNEVEERLRINISELFQMQWKKDCLGMQ